MKESRGSIEYQGKNETKRPRGYSRRNEGRRMSQGRNEEIRKGGIGIGRRRWRKRRKRKRKGQETTEESCTLIYVVGCRNDEKRRWKEKG